MAYFLFHGSYSPEAMAALIEDPEDRSVYIRSIVEKMKGRLEGFWLAFGASDFYVVVQLPDAENAAAFAMSIIASGRIRHFNTVHLLTWSEGINALNLAHRFGYQAPSLAVEGEPRD